MKISYDEDADALYIKLKEGEVAKTKEVDTMLDYDSQENLLGIELLFVKERMPQVLKKVQVENITV